MSLGKPPRLAEVFQKYDPPVYFVTLCTNDRRKTLANAAVCSAVIEYGRRGLERGFVLSRYVIIPDHIHLFITGADDFNSGVWVRGLKRVVAAAVSGGRVGLWQPGFLDHLIRSGESYSEKWNYVRDNPVRAGLTSHAEEWAYQGEIVWIDRA